MSRATLRAMCIWTFGQEAADSFPLNGVGVNASIQYFSHSRFASSPLRSHFEPQFNKADDQDFAPVFRAHARIYTFVRMRLVDNLRALALSKLHKTLISFTVYQNRVDDTVKLARYACTDEYIPDRTEDGETDELRHLVVNYIASEFDIIGKATVFIAFLEAGGEFVGDFFSALPTGLL